MSVKYPARARLPKIETRSPPVIQNKCEKVLRDMLYCWYQVISLYGHQLAVSWQEAYHIWLWQLAFATSANQAQPLPNILKSLQI